ncbi:MAG: RnfABCDGE type electron transport complex subunit D [Candidatus Dormibacteria bacterium]
MSTGSPYLPAETGPAGLAAGAPAGPLAGAVRLLLGPQRDVAVLVALLPLWILSVVFFRVSALEKLGLALALGVAASAAWTFAMERPGDRELLRRFTPLVSPTVAALATGLLLPPHLPWYLGLLAIAVALVFDVAAAPAAGWFRVHPALVGSVLVFIAGRQYFTVLANPFTLDPNVDPLAIQGPAPPIDPARLYVGDIPSLLGSSVLAAALGLVILYYWKPVWEYLRNGFLGSYRGGVVLWALAGFLAGEAVAGSLAGADLTFQLVQAPAFLAAGILAGELRLMEDRMPVGLATGVVGGLVTIVLRQRYQLGVESAPLGALVTMALGTPLARAYQSLRPALPTGPGPRVAAPRLLSEREAVVDERAPEPPVPASEEPPAPEAGSRARPRRAAPGEEGPGPRRPPRRN